MGIVLGPVAWGFRIQPTFALVRVVRGDLSWDIHCPIPQAHCMLGLLAYVVRRMSLDSWALGCPGSGNILFQRRMSSFKRTNGIPESRS